jgi:hypothetical protein
MGVGMEDFWASGEEASVWLSKGAQLSSPGGARWET